MKRFVVVGLLTFGAAMAWKIGDALSTDAIAMMLGLMLGLAGGLAAVLIVLLTRQRHAPQQPVAQADPYAQRPPLFIVMSDAQAMQRWQLPESSRRETMQRPVVDAADAWWGDD